MTLSNIKNHYSFNLLSLFGYLNTILLVLWLTTFFTYMEYNWFYLVIVFYILMTTLSVENLLAIFSYIYECSNENFRIKNEKFLSNKLIHIFQIIGFLLNLVLLTIFISLIIFLITYSIINK